MSQPAAESVSLEWSDKSYDRLTRSKRAFEEDRRRIKAEWQVFGRTSGKPCEAFILERSDPRVRVVSDFLIALSHIRDSPKRVSRELIALSARDQLGDAAMDKSFRRVIGILLSYLEHH